MNIGMVCYASVGGSGVIATELACALALRGHQLHVISTEPPFRWRPNIPGLSFERVDVPPYPLFREPQYLLALTNTIARVAEERQLDIVHAHYAVPHATAAYLAGQMLASSITPGAPAPRNSPGAPAPRNSPGVPVPRNSLRTHGDRNAPLRAPRSVPPRTVTTLHGTDITLVGSDPSYARVVAFSIERSDGVTAVSNSLKADTIASLGIRRDIRVIPNFLDCAEYRRRPEPELRARVCPPDRYDALVIHVSNMRPVKRVDVALDAFRIIRRHVRARFVLVGDGPVRLDIERRAAHYGLGADVLFVGEQQDLVAWLSVADLFLLPSAQESFGLAALEAMACEVAVVASGVGGLPEIVHDGVTGFLCPPGSADAMAERSIAVLSDRALHKALTSAAAEMVRTRYCTDLIVPLYEAEYQSVAAGVGTR